MSCTKCVVASGTVTTPCVRAVGAGRPAPACDVCARQESKGPGEQGERGTAQEDGEAERPPEGLTFKPSLESARRGLPGARVKGLMRGLGAAGSEWGRAGPWRVAGRKLGRRGGCGQAGADLARPWAASMGRG